MNETLKQDISALLDGELDELGMARVLGAADDRQVRAQVKEYSMVQSLLHSEMVEPSAFSLDISAKVRDEIQNGAIQNNAKPVVAKSWLKPALGFAMAASMAFVTVFSIDYLRTDTLDTQLASNEFSSDASGYDSEEQAVSSSLAASSVNVENVSHVSLAEEELNDPFQAAVAADQELRKRENALLEAQQQNVELQQHLRQYLISHARQNVNAPVNSALPIARASHTGY